MPNLELYIIKNVLDKFIYNFGVFINIISTYHKFFYQKIYNIVYLCNWYKY